MHNFLDQLSTVLPCRRWPPLALTPHKSSEFTGDAARVPKGSTWIKIDTYKLNIHMN